MVPFQSFLVLLSKVCVEVDVHKTPKSKAELQQKPFRESRKAGVLFQSDLKTNRGRFCSWVAKNDEYDERTFVTLLGACFYWIQRILDLKIRDPRSTENL